MTGITEVIDTHCHLGDPAFDPDRSEVIDRLHTAGVARAVVVESDLGRLDDTRAWLQHQPRLGLAAGCHPHDAANWGAEMADRLIACWQSGAVAAGEMGLDYHYDHSPRDVQRRVFAAQLALAEEHQLPVVIHAREADADVAAILREHPAARVVLHSFSSGRELLEAGLELGCWFSFSGMITFRSWQDDAAVMAVPIDRIMVETDSPYLAPVPHRGRRNEPAFVVEVVRRLAEVREIAIDVAREITTRNAEALFWPQPTG